MNLDFLNKKSILVTGGTGSLGKHLIATLLKDSKASRVAVFSRDELKQSQMQKEFNDDRLRFFIGDVRDIERLRRAFSTVDVVIHAAALKQVPALEYNPLEAVKTNIIGTENVIEAALDRGVEKVIVVSTDKAAYPSNLYGSTNLCAEKLAVAANSYPSGKTKFSVVRYGNVIGSRGSIVDILSQTPRPKVLHVTDPKMTRFWIMLEESVAFVLLATREMEGGEIFVPKLPSMRLDDMLNALAPDIPQKLTGPRAGEKLHELMLTDQESRHTREFPKYYVVLPEFAFWATTQFKKYEKGKKLPDGFSYESDTNTEWLTKKDLLKMVRTGI